MRLVPRLAPVATLTLAVLLAGCAAGQKGEAETAPGTSAVAETAPGTAAETAAPLSPAEYLEALTAAVEPVREALAGIEAAKKYRALRTSVSKAERAASGAAETLAELAPPRDAAAAHDLLVGGLGQLARALGNAAEAVDARGLCGSPSVLARLGAAKGAERLRSATRELRAAGYEVEAFAPRAVPMPARRLETGAFLVPIASPGGGVLEVENGLALDAVAVLVRGKERVASVYVRRNHELRIEGIPAGTYRIYFTVGADWDQKLEGFTRQCRFQRFDDPVEFTSSTGYRITLHPVLGGAAPTSDVGPDEFPG